MALIEAPRKYTVRVMIKYVDFAQDYLCGYLTIDDLTEQYPQLTTFFDGDIISGPSGRHSFVTHRWDADETTDSDNWQKFKPFREVIEQTNNDSDRDLSVRDLDAHFRIDEEDVKEERSRYVFMRWKELFLVPDHRIRSVQGASYDGFYYIMYDAKEDVIDGYYYHDTSDRNQHLELHPMSRERSGSFDFH
jgi:hypothetical protein